MKEIEFKKEYILPILMLLVIGFIFGYVSGKNVKPGNAADYIEDMLHDDHPIPISLVNENSTFKQLRYWYDHYNMPARFMLERLIEDICTMKTKPTIKLTNCHEMCMGMCNGN